MNLVDLLILAFFAVSALIGFYRGFVSSGVNTLALFLSLVIAYFCYPLVSEWIAGHQDWLDYLIYLSEGSSHIPTAYMEFARTDVAVLSVESVKEVIAAAGFTAPFDGYLLSNITARVYAPELTLLGEYFDQTVADATLNLVSFVLCGALTYLLASVLVYLVDQTIRFPLLVQLDSVTGALVGLLRGYVILLVLFVMVPLVMNMLQIGMLQDMLDASHYAGWFLGENPFFHWITPFV